MRDFLAFRTIVTPIIIQLVFWLGVGFCLVFGLSFILWGGGDYDFGLGGSVITGVLIILLGPLAVRIYCEILIVFFRINETLTEIKHSLERQPEAGSQ